MITIYVQNLIEYLFTMGLQQEILLHLLLYYNIQISHSSLKRILHRKKLFRRNHYAPLCEIVQFIQNQVNLSSQLHGYRWMHLQCIQNGLAVTQNCVRVILKEIDPQGVQQRKRKRLRRRKYANKGPNYVWHTDCYDKLKPYGICISGCIDGFSRHIIWLKATNNTSNPKIIAGHYINAVKYIGGCPQRMRADMGTENRYIEQIQIFFRQTPVDQHDMYYGTASFLYGKSTANQRIESWWSMLRKQHAQFWINLFETLKDDGYFTGSFLYKNIIQFCFMKIIQNELKSVVTEWNAHRIRKSKNSTAPTGRPINMYLLPELYDTRNFICNVSAEKINICMTECQFTNEIPCDTDIFDLCNILMDENNLEHKLNDPLHAVDLYVKLRSKLIELI